MEISLALILEMKLEAGRVAVNKMQTNKPVFKKNNSIFWVHLEYCNKIVIGMLIKYNAFLKKQNAALPDCIY